ncbi:MAG: type II toxin-antitoxin system VapC family toxin [Candidatus Binatia bacterium]
MHYWDASAIVPLCVEEESSARLRALARAEGIVTWCLSAVEVRSGIERRAREGSLAADAREKAAGDLRELADAWTEVTMIGPVKERALRLLAVHALRAADAVQLAAALVVTEDQPAGHSFVSLDARLRAAAEREGFSAAG